MAPEPRRPNTLYECWKALVPQMKDILRLAECPSWDVLQQTENLSFARETHSRIQAARKANREFDARYIEYKRRRVSLRRFFSYSVPSPEALEYLANQNLKIFEVGCGKGYWASILRSIGIDIIASDRTPMDQNRWIHGKDPFMSDIHVDSVVSSLLTRFAERSLLIQWIPSGPDGAFGCEMLKEYNGEDLFFVGEPAHGATACDAWYELLDRDWVCVTSLPLPRFIPILDSLYHFQRKNKGKKELFGAQ